MMKKLMSLIFEEEVVDEVEEEPVPVRRANPAKPSVQSEVKPPVPLPQEVKAVLSGYEKREGKRTGGKEGAFQQAGENDDCGRKARQEKTGTCGTQGRL